MKKYFIRYILSVFVVLLTFNVALAASSPVPMLQQTANKIIKELQKNQANLKTNPTISYKLVKQHMLPLVAQKRMAQQVVGRNYWFKASKAQRQQFVSQFETLVIRTYAAAIARFTDETVRFLPIRGGISGRSLVRVASQIIKPGRPPINVVYNMLQINGKWKVIDFSVDGVSLIDSFRSQFAPVLAQSGMRGLIKQLKMHNSRKNA